MIEIAYYEHLPTGVASLALALLVATWRRWIRDWIDVLVVSVSFLVILPPVWMILLGGSNALSPENLWWATLLPAVAWCYAYGKILDMRNEDRRAPNEGRRNDRPGVRGIIAFLGVCGAAAIYSVNIDERVVVYDHSGAGELVPATEAARVSEKKEQTGSSSLPPNDRELSAGGESVDRALVETDNFEVLLAAAASGDVGAQTEVARIFTDGERRPTLQPETVERLSVAANQGYAYAQLVLGILGVGVLEDRAQGLEWIRKAADQDFAYAQFELGSFYENGRFVPHDQKRAVELYREAAEQGVAIAQFMLGQMYLRGDGVAQSDPLAADWIRKGADQGFPVAQYILGSMYGGGRGVPKNDALSANWYRKAADQGFPYAQESLGFMYGGGRGVPKNDALSANWYRKAADQGLASAQYRLGLAYFEGTGVPKNDMLALEWFRHAADQGDVNAQHALGFMYSDGIRAPIDLRQAYFWLLLSAATRDESRELRDEVEERLTPADRAAVQAEALAWKPKEALAWKPRRTQSAR